MPKLRLSSFFIVAATVAFCGGCGGPRLVPVQGRVTMAGKPVTKGHIWFVPDPDKGNKHTGFSPAAFDADGRFELKTADKQGIPMGWYKVVIYSTKNEAPESPWGWKPDWLVPEKYSTPQTSDLAVEVVAKPAPGAYDFDIKP